MCTLALQRELALAAVLILHHVTCFRLSLLNTPDPIKAPVASRSSSPSSLSSNQSRVSGVWRLQSQATATREKRVANCPQILILLQRRTGQGGKGREHQALLLNTKPPEESKTEAGKERKHCPNLTH